MNIKQLVKYPVCFPVYWMFSLALREGQLDHGRIFHVLTPPCREALVSCLLLLHLCPGRPCASTSARCWFRPAPLLGGGGVTHMVQYEDNVLIKRPASEEGGSEGERGTIGWETYALTSTKTDGHLLMLINMSRMFYWWTCMMASSYVILKDKSADILSL